MTIIPQAFSVVLYHGHHPSIHLCCIIPWPSPLNPSLLYYTMAITPQAFSAVLYHGHHPSSLPCCIIPWPSSLNPSLLYYTMTTSLMPSLLHYTVTTIPLASLVYYIGGLIKRKPHSKIEYMELNGERYLKFK